ncbi:MAG: J domain-containing protein [Vicinamibacterales bacterium]
MDQRANYYHVLHVQPGAPQEIIHMSYVTLMRQLRMHPDLGGDSETAALINQAFAVLRDPAKRAIYDRELELAFKGNVPAGEVLALPSAIGAAPTPAPPTAKCGFCTTLFLLREAESPSSTCATCASPLFPMARLREDDATCRIFHRLRREWPVSFHESWPLADAFAGTSWDFSISGMRFFTFRQLRTGQRIRIGCAFCDALAIVRHVERATRAIVPRWSIGVEFLTLRVIPERGGILSAHA